MSRACYESFATSESKFDLYADLDTRDLPQMTNSNNVAFHGSEISVYGIGATDALSNLTDISGQVGAADTTNGTTGVAWLYEKVAAPNPNSPPGSGNAVSEMLYLVDAGDGGDAGQGGTRPFDWTILASIDLSGTSSGWFRLGIDIDALGNGIARFDNQFFNFTTALHSAPRQMLPNTLCATSAHFVVFAAHAGAIPAHSDPTTAAPPGFIGKTLAGNCRCEAHVGVRRPCELTA